MTRILKRWRRVLLSLAVATLIICLLWIFPRKRSKKGPTLIFDEPGEGLARKGMGCEMPVLDPFSPELMAMEKNISKVVCEGMDWVRCYKAECFVVPQILKKFQSVICTYRDILFKTDFDTDLGEPTEVYGHEKYILKNSDYAQVACHGMGFYGMFSSHWLGHVAGYRPTSALSTPAVNLLLLLFDSTSRVGFIRRMPRSYRVLRDNLNAVVMESYNVVGDATLAALFPILTGKRESEQPSAEKQLTSAKLNVSYFLFNLFKEKGYRTAYHEDFIRAGTFQYCLNGFDKPPTDHYFRLLLLAEHKSFKNQTTSIFTMKKKKNKFCLGAIPQHLLLLNYTTQFFNLDSSMFCLTFIGDICHDHFNEISVADDDLAEFLIKFKKDGRLENTAVFVMGDHGSRFNNVRNTYQGRMEERLPLVTVILPEKLKRERPDALLNLIDNSKTLTSPFDIHTTVLDIVGEFHLRNQHKVNGSSLERGMSFLRPIPKSRTCLEADIAPYWCACTKWYNVPVSDPMFVRVGRALADYIDNFTVVKRDLCAKRMLTSIAYVIVRDSNKHRTEDFFVNATRTRLSNEYYQTQISMSPGTATFEGAVEYILKEDMFIISEKQISRINAYGDEPNCVKATQPQLNKYCYCKNTLDNEVQT